MPVISRSEVPVEADLCHVGALGRIVEVPLVLVLALQRHIVGEHELGAQPEGGKRFGLGIGPDARQTGEGEAVCGKAELAVRLALPAVVVDPGDVPFDTGEPS